jgi:4,5-dihydroxyphthalate decarboxylase
MGNDRITLACRNYDRTQAILRGLVEAPGIELQVREMHSVPRMFAGFFRGDYDVSEFSLAELVYYTSRGHDAFWGIPIFPSRVFRHGFIFCNAASGVRGLESLAGKKIGFPRLVQTASIWIRGTLLDGYGLRPEEIQWYAASLHHWDGHEGAGAIQPRDGSVIHLLERDGRDENESMELALREGRIDVLGSTQLPNYFGTEPCVKRLFENYREVEKAYFKRTGIFPIMHVLAARRGVVDQHPELPGKLFQLFCKAKRWGREWIRTDPSLALAWKNSYLEEEKKIFNGDPWVYGLKENTALLSQFLAYCHDLGVSDKTLSPKDLFHPSTWDLTDEV